MNEEEEIDALWNKAIYNAKEAFKNTFNNEGYDSAFWMIKIISHCITTDFKDILETKTWNDYGKHGFKEMIDK